MKANSLMLLAREQAADIEDRLEVSEPMESGLQIPRHAWCRKPLRSSIYTAWRKPWMHAQHKARKTGEGRKTYEKQ